MRKVVIHKPGAYDQLRLEECPDPSPGPGDVLVDVKGIGVNYADCITRMGLYPAVRKAGGYPLTPGFEVAGVVSTTGPGVRDLTPGMRVLGITLFNGYSTRIVLPSQQVFPVPESIALEEAAGFPTAFLTAWYALFELAHPKAGQVMLVHSAAGGVGSALVQLGCIAGCEVVAVVGQNTKVAAANASGADHVIDKSTEDLWEAAKRLAPRGYDIVLDANGIDTLRESHKHLAPMGKLVVYGFHSMLPKTGGKPNWLKLAVSVLRMPRFNPLDLSTKNHSVMGFNLSFLEEEIDLLKTAMEQLLIWLGEGRLTLAPTRRYPLEQVAQAHRDLESGRTIGKLVLVVDD